MFGWLSARPISASRRKRSRNSGLSSSVPSGRFSATISDWRSALKTEAIPPRPRTPSRRYSPNHSRPLSSTLAPGLTSERGVASAPGSVTAPEGRVTGRAGSTACRRTASHANAATAATASANSSRLVRESPIGAGDAVGASATWSVRVAPAASSTACVASARPACATRTRWTPGARPAFTSRPEAGSVEPTSSSSR